MRSGKADIRPYIRQFYRGNGLCFALAMVQILLMTGNGVVFGIKLIPTVAVTVFFRPFHKRQAPWERPGDSAGAGDLPPRVRPPPDSLL